MTAATFDGPPCGWLVDHGLLPEADSPADRDVRPCGAPTRTWEVDGVYGEGWACAAGHRHEPLELELAPGGPEWRREQRERNRR